MRRSSIAVVLAALLTAQPVRASEPAAGGGVEAAEAYDTVVLRDGSVLRGTIVELLPGRAVTIRVATGTTQTIEWSEVESTAFAGSGPAPSCPLGPDPLTGVCPEKKPPTTLGPPPPPVPTVLEPGPGQPRVFIESSRPAPVQLFDLSMVRPVGGNPWRSPRSLPRLVCEAPCGQVIDARAGYPYQVGGDRITPSKLFYLGDTAGDVVLKVRPGRRGVLIGSLPVMWLGLAGTGTGAVLSFWHDHKTRVAGSAVLGAGLALLITGIVMMVRGVTRVRVERRNSGGG